MINKKEPSVKKSFRLPFDLAFQIDEISEMNGVPFSEVVKQLLVLGIKELNRMDQEEGEKI